MSYVCDSTATKAPDGVRKTAMTYCEQRRHAQASARPSASSSPSTVRARISPIVTTLGYYAADATGCDYAAHKLLVSQG